MQDKYSDKTSSRGFSRADTGQQAVHAFDSGQRPPHQKPQGMAARVMLNVPYPKPKFSCPNVGYAGAIKNAYAGDISEFTSISQYFYQHVLERTPHPEVSAVLKAVAMVEMKHAELLAECICDLGGDASISSQRGNARIWWSGGFVSYQNGLRAMLMKNIEMERMAIREYQRLCRAIPLEDIHALFERIIMDEKHHIDLFSELLRLYCGYE